MLTANGAVPIFEIEAGQQVLAAPDDGLAESYASNAVGTKIVVGEASLVQLHVLHEDGSQETINTTDEHPFHAADTGEWTRADQLRVGDRLSTIAGTAELLGVRYTTERVPVYNLSIPGTPTYYVGEHGVWVHNCDIDPNKLKHIFGKPQHYLDDFVQTMGSREDAFVALQQAAQRTVERLGIASGNYEESVNIYGYLITVRGAVVDGVARIGTAFIP